MSAKLLDFLPRITFNAPLTIDFAAISFVALIVDVANDGNLTKNLFSTPQEFHPTNPVSYLRLVAYVFGHGNWEHLRGNLLLIILLGPLLEEKYGSTKILLMAFATALLTGILHTAFSAKILLGASGIVSMMIALGSITNVHHSHFKSNRLTITLTFFLAWIAFFAQDAQNLFKETGVSHFAHIMGAAVGFLFGTTIQPKNHLTQTQPSPK